MAHQRFTSMLHFVYSYCHMLQYNHYMIFYDFMIILINSSSLLLFLFSTFFPPDTVRKSVSDGTLTSPHADPSVPVASSDFSGMRESLKSQTCQNLTTHNEGTSTSSSHNKASPFNLRTQTVCEVYFLL